jgi:hypothetical protein
MAGISRIASGTIYPSRFVTLDTTTMGHVLQATAGQQVYGISGPGTDRPPFGALDTGQCAVIGEQLEIFEAGDSHDTVVPLQLGGTVTQGDRLKSDANGCGVTTTTTSQEVGAIAEVSGVSGNIVPVRLVFPVQY